MTRPTFLPWWQCAALLIDPVEVQAATAGEAEDVARAEWRGEGERPEVVETRRIEHPSTTTSSIDAPCRDCISYVDTHETIDAGERDE